MTTERLTVINPGNTYPAYADRLIIEQHGPVSHLIFCYTENEFPGSEKRNAVVASRVIVPTTLVAKFAHQLATERSTVIVDDDTVPEMAKQH